MTIEEILNLEGTEAERILALQEKTLTLPLWYGPRGLESEYDPRKHPVMNRQQYPDVVTDRDVERVTRITLDFQRLAVKRMSELVCGIPVKRVYKALNDRQRDIAAYIEAVFQRNRIDSLNIERTNMLFASCEVMTLWYAVEQPNSLYGFDSPLKLRCRNFSPMTGDTLYPFFDEYGDMTAMSVAYRRKVDRKTVDYFDTYTADRHIKWSNASGQWERVEDERTTMGKIPAVYAYRLMPVWEDTSRNIYEMEWALSRNGNYLRKNAKPRFCVFADDVINYGDEKSQDREFLGVMQYPKGSTAQYITWPQAVENLKFYVDTLRSLFFTQLQLPDWSYEKMSQQALSGESRKQMFIDSQLKVKDESGRLLEFFDRELNVVKSFLKVLLPAPWARDIDALQVETQITPFTIGDEKETIENLMTANGNVPIISQREAIEQLGWSADPQRTIDEITAQKAADAMEPTL